ncbi:Molybdenum cofactor biosynthesis, MoeB [Moorella glycerini]|uniref:Adenylyltransferase/sulfurtransferase MoeZ n=1 Tax=Neomoorella stamsii TaxID=1266720 RepID=A0A9X7J0L1_9FIRM|nr:MULTISPECIES: molybdopterin-synthase adenylyltransferase MoeB [Moorella]PRR68882.1 putative adenylyltransferase/sulfurtransferase MoeZ [Moorella stamsii]CEP67503.1 Molybdenum cofactor biosynthesis, MoeB [Moorella glycerini]
MALTNEEIERYSRQIILKNVGGRGQEKLKQGKVLIVGAGGLGSPVAYYLAAAGVGTVGIVDSDRVDLSNLQRQILHNSDRLGRLKAESARETLLALNPALTINTYPLRLGKDNILAIIRDYDVIVDGVDNFPTRYLLNDACVMTGKTMVEGGVLQWDGLVMTIKPGQGPCYRCIFPDPPPPGAVPSCQEAGVMGPVPGLIGAIQATEVIKILLGVGETLTGRLLIYNALEMRFREIKAERNRNCPVCGENPRIRELEEYTFVCKAKCER